MSLLLDPPLSTRAPQHIQHGWYSGNGQHLLLKSLHELEILHGEVLVHNAERVELRVDRICEFTTALQSDFTLHWWKSPTNTSRVCSSRPTGSLPQRKAKGKAKQDL